MASEIISAIVSRFQGVRRRVLWLRGDDRAQAVLAVRVMGRYGKCPGEQKTKKTSGEAFLFSSGTSKYDRHL